MEPPATGMNSWAAALFRNHAGGGDHFVGDERAFGQERGYSEADVIQGERDVFRGGGGRWPFGKANVGQACREGFESRRAVFVAPGEDVIDAAGGGHVTGFAGIGEEADGALGFHEEQVSNVGQKRERAFGEVGHLRGFERASAGGDLAHVARGDDADAGGGGDSSGGAQGAVVGCRSTEQDSGSRLAQEGGGFVDGRNLADGGYDCPALDGGLRPGIIGGNDEVRNLSRRTPGGGDGFGGGGSDIVRRSGHAHVRGAVACSPTMLTTGDLALRALWKLARAFPRPGPRWRSVAAALPRARA